MSDKSVFAETFDRDTDPLAEFEEKFNQLDADPYRVFVAESVASNGVKEGTVDRYRSTWDEWKDFMASEGRHPACPAEAHVKAWLRHEMDEKGNSPQTAKEKLRRLNKGYEYWQDDSHFPHPAGFNPFESAKKEVDLSRRETKEFHPLTVDGLRDVIETVKAVRQRAVIVTQLKTGLRASELGNIRLREISIENAELKGHYGELGQHPNLTGKGSAVFIPHDREGNKSQVDRILPLDGETRRVLLEWLLIRPDNGEPWLFLSDTRHDQLQKEGINEMWRDAFHPEYAETDEYRGITSHFGRHFVTTWFRSEKDIGDEKVKYLRGDKKKEETMDTYTHTGYRHLEEAYRKQIFNLKFGL